MGQDQGVHPPALHRQQVLVMVMVPCDSSPLPVSVEAGHGVSVSTLAKGIGKGETHTRRGIGTSAISSSGADASEGGATAGGGCPEVGLVALWEPWKGGAMEGSPERVLGTTSGRGVSCGSVRSFQYEQVRWAKY